MNAEVAYKKVFGRPESLKPNPTHYCPGCGHSIAHRLVAECLDEMGRRLVYRQWVVPFWLIITLISIWWRRPMGGLWPWQQGSSGCAPTVLS